jgi:hypothetical protein
MDKINNFKNLSNILGTWMESSFFKKEKGVIGLFESCLKTR